MTDNNLKAVDGGFAFWQERFDKCDSKYRVYQKMSHANREMMKCELVVWEIPSSVEPVDLLLARDRFTLFTCFMSAVAILCKRYMGDDVLQVYTPPLAIGGKAETVRRKIPLVLDIDWSHSLRELLQEIQSQMKMSYESQDALSGFLDSTPTAAERLGSNVLLSFDQIHDKLLNAADHDLVINVSFSHEVKMEVQYDKHSFDETFPAQFNSHLRNVLSAFSDLETRAIDVGIFDDSELALLTNRAARIEAPTSRMTLHGLFREQVLKTPDAPAIVFDDTRLTYKELDEKTDAIARHLVEQYSISKGDVVAIFLERSERLVIAILSILKAGAAYVPIDDGYPSDRVSYILTDSGATTLITESGMLKQPDSFKGAVFCIDTENVGHGRAVNIEVSPGDLAYIIYTSGSTGTPKGVMLEHGGASNMILRQKEFFGISSGDSVALFASVAFDASVSEIFKTLAAGACLHVLKKYEAKNAGSLLGWLRDRGVTVITLPPFYLNSIDLDDLKFLRVLITAGDRADPANAIYCSKFLNYYNAYGPTECSVCTTIQKVTADIGDVVSIPIGKPILNTKVYLLDLNQQLTPAGFSGEIYIGGVGVARGYRNREDLTKDKFIPDFIGKAGRLYRTGDRGRMLPDGSIEYIGRIDDQVKIRGYRIEPGEIRSNILQFEGVDEAVVIPLSDQSETHLAAYVVGAGVEIYLLREYLKDKLPAYMVPSYIVKVETIHLTSNGKIDKKLLPSPFDAAEATIPRQGPRTSTELKLVQIFEETLGRTVAGINEDFFELGGHSLKAIQVTSRIHKELGVKIELEAVFNYPTVSQLAEHVDQQSTDNYSSIPTSARLEHYPLSHSQRRLWVLSQFEEGGIAYNIPGSYEIEGDLRLDLLLKSLQQLLQRHEILRTTFEVVNKDPRQKINDLPAIVLPYRYEDLSEHADAQSRVNELIKADVITPFDLSKAPLLRLLAIRISQRKHIVVFTVHHIISDGWSMKIMIRELGNYYNALLKGASYKAQELRIQYKDYALWQNTELEAGKLNADLDYWRNELGNETDVLTLPADSLRPAVKTFRGSRRRLRIRDDAYRFMESTALAHDSSLFMVLVSTLSVLLHRYSGQEEFTIGTPVAGRGHYETEDQLGLYVNTVALRLNIAGTDDFATVLSKVRRKALDGFSHQGYPFDRLVDDLGLKRDVSRSAVFDIMVGLQDDAMTLGKNMFDGATLKEYPMDFPASKFDMNFTFQRNNGGLDLELEYNTDLFTGRRISRMLDHYQDLLVEISRNGSAKIASLNYMGADEEKLIVEEFNATNVPFEDATLIELFERQVLLKGGRAALRFGNTSWGYEELNEKANDLSHYLIGKFDIKSGDVVGLLLDRSEWVVIGILAILKSGAAYMPLDPGYPSDRKKFMIDDCQVKVLLTEKGQYENDDYQIPIIELGGPDPYEAYGSINPGRRCKSSDLAYIIYTSGSTGLPKGVEIEHRGAVNRINWMWKKYNFTAGDVILQKTPLIFDVSVWELFMPLCFGCCLVLCKKDVPHDPEKLVEHIVDHSITTLHFVPSMLSVFLKVTTKEVAARMTSLRHVMASGEALTAEVVKDYYEKFSVPLHNLYGPTEASVDVTFYETRTGDKVIPIGKPIDNTSIFVLDRNSSLVPIGIPGEVCIGGVGLARGYRNRPDLTKQRFIDNPVNAGTTLYRTGDLGRWREDGQIEYLGRIDDQVKISGYRIEPGEIRNRLLQYPGINDAVVTTFERGGLQQLVAYVVGQSLDNVLLKQFLRDRLPGYMVPSFIVEIEKLPLTSSGKIDSKKLPAPGEEQALAATTCPRNRPEEQLLEIWEDVFARKDIGVHDNFFEIGGNSIMMILLFKKVNDMFPGVFKVHLLFSNLTIAAQAMLITNAEVGTGIEGKECDVVQIEI